MTVTRPDVGILLTAVSKSWVPTPKRVVKEDQMGREVKEGPGTFSWVAASARDRGLKFLVVQIVKLFSRLGLRRLH